MLAEHAALIGAIEDRRAVSAAESLEMTRKAPEGKCSFGGFSTLRYLSRPQDLGRIMWLKSSTIFLPVSAGDSIHLSRWIGLVHLPR